MQDLIDNSEIEKVLEKLESLEDEALAVEYLGKFNAATKKLGVLIMNTDESLEHETWQQECEKARKELNELLKLIEDL